MKIKFLGRHNSESNHTRLVSFIINDTLAIDAGSLASGLSFAEQKKINAILLSHAHYDHIRDLPAFVFNNLERKVQLYGLNSALDLVSKHIFNGMIYPKFTDVSSFVKQPVLELCPLELHHPYKIGDFTIIAKPMKHTIDTAGFEIAAQEGKKVFYTGDTGSDLSYLWNDIKPDLLIIDLTFPNRFTNEANNSGHLCPDLLKKELESFGQTKGYLPQVFPIHLYPQFENEIIKEANKVAGELGFTICSLNNENELII
jgi:ribonuclease BN (tRNA processing enzyme)